MSWPASRQTASSTDNRAVNVMITERGLDLFKAAQDRHLLDLEEHLFSFLTEPEIHQLATIAGKILAHQQHRARPGSSDR